MIRIIFRGTWTLTNDVVNICMKMPKNEEWNQSRESNEWKAKVLPVLQLQCENTCLNENTFAGKRCLNMGSSWISKCTPCTPRITRLWATHYPRDGSLAGKFKLSDGTATAIFPRAILDATHRKVQNQAIFNNMIQNATQTQYMSKISQFLYQFCLPNHMTIQPTTSWVNMCQHGSTQQLRSPILSLFWNLDTPRKHRFPETNM